MPSPGPDQPFQRKPRWREGVLATLATVVVLVAAAGAASYLVIAQAQAKRARAESLTGGRVDRAALVMVANGCAGCHVISGVPGADGQVGPPLSGLTQRAYLGGAVENSPANLVAWIRNAPSLEPHTAMPATGVSEQQARDVAAFLYTR